jgi:hypothetical protein
VFDWITGVTERLGYVGVAALTFLENFVSPIPSELVIPLARFVAAQGNLNFCPRYVAVTGRSWPPIRARGGDGRHFLLDGRLRLQVDGDGLLLARRDAQSRRDGRKPFANSCDRDGARRHLDGHWPLVRRLGCWPERSRRS